jgi:hypothetical protein
MGILWYSGFAGRSNMPIIETLDDESIQ